MIQPIFVNTLAELKAQDHGSIYSVQSAKFPPEWRQGLYLIEAGFEEQGQNLGLSQELAEQISKIWARKSTAYLGGSFLGCLAIKTIVARIGELT